MVQGFRVLSFWSKGFRVVGFRKGVENAPCKVAIGIYDVLKVQAFNKLWVPLLGPGS